MHVAVFGHFKLCRVDLADARPVLRAGGLRAEPHRPAPARRDQRVPAPRVRPAAPRLALRRPRAQLRPEGPMASVPPHGQGQGHPQEAAPRRR